MAKQGLRLGVCLWFASGCAVGSGGAQAHAPVASRDEPARRLHGLATEYVAAYLRMFPDQGEYDGRSLAGHDALPDNSSAALEAWHGREDAWLAALAGFDAVKLWGTPEWALLGYLRSTLESSIATRVCHAELWPAHQFGWQSRLLGMLDSQPLGTSLARTEALARWRQLPRFVDTEVANLRQGLQRGYSAPRRNVELAVQQLDALLALAKADSPLSSLAKRDVDSAFQANWYALVTAELLPAVKRYRDFLRSEYAPASRTTLSIADLPDGLACYRAQIKTYTTTELEPAALYRLGLERVAERETRALRLANALYGVNDLRAAKLALDSDPRNRFASGDEALAFITEALGRARTAAPRWFSRSPHTELVLLPFNDAEAKTHPGARYEPAAKDGSHPAWYRIDVTNFAALRRSELEHITFHEGIPGHHLQMGLAQESFTEQERADSTCLGAFIEGWGRYSETLADEMGLYRSDLERFGAFALLPTGLVVDPGIHALGWTRQRAIDWVMAKQAGFSADDAAAYVDRIAVFPGLMLSYGFGELEITRIRQQAEVALGPKFELQAFHDRVLANGGITLPMLREVIRRWVAAQPPQ